VAHAEMRIKKKMDNFIACFTASP